MPPLNRTAYRQQSGEYLNSLRPPNTQTERGVLKKKTVRRYRSYLDEAGELLGYAPPRSITLPQMKELEGRIRAKSNRTLAQKLSVIRAFLRWCGNTDALRWRWRITITPYRGGVFLREPQVAVLHQEAAELGAMWELMISLAVDMGLRWVDVENLTLDNAEEWLAYQESMILGKGRDGGKLALQMLSQYTRPLLERYLENRKILVRRTGDTTRKLIVHEVYRGKRRYLAFPEEKALKQVMDYLSDKVGVRFRFHDLRRTLGNRLWRLGKKIETIAKILRHEDSGVTFRAYIGVDADDMREALDSLSKVSGDCPGVPGQA